MSGGVKHMNNVMDVINKRASVRKFNDKPISEEIMSQIIHAAMRAPTAGNMMMYSVIKVKNKETLKLLSKSCDHQPFIERADTALIFLADMNKWHKYFLLNGVKEYAEKTNRTYDGPTIADFMLAVGDALIAAENTVVAAESFDIGSCYIGDIMENLEYHRDLLNLPEYVFPATMVIFGNYDHYPAVKDRFDEKYVVFDEKYHEFSDSELRDMFKKREASFNPETMKAFDNYAQAFYNRKIGSDFFDEMNRSISKAIKEWTNS